MAQKRRHPFFLWRPLETGSGRGSEDRGPNSPRSRPASLMDRSRRNSWSTRRSKLASGRRAPKKVHSTWINNTCIYILFPTWFLLLLSPDKMNKSNEREIFIKRIINIRSIQMFLRTDLITYDPTFAQFEWNAQRKREREFRLLRFSRVDILGVEVNPLHISKFSPSIMQFRNFISRIFGEPITLNDVC